MSDWTSGYVADVDYTIGYFPELNPVRLPLGLLNAGYVPPKVVNACELGFGQGLSIAAHAAAQPGVRWYGDDFNPGHVLFARWVNDAAGADAVLTDESFEEFCSREDLPMFDVIGLHGVWSWVGAENRAIIVDFIRRKLNVGGVVYCSYNVMPGWAPMTPVRELMTLHAKMNGTRGQTSGEKVAASLEFMEGFFNKDPRYLAANATVREKFENLKSMPAGYLSHEYMNAGWDSMYFSQIADVMAEAKLEFACSAAYQDAVDELHYTQEQQEWLAGITSEPFRETLRDFIRNTQFRKDYWVKGGRDITATEQVEAIRATRVVLLTVRDSIPYTANTTLGQASLMPEVYGPILDLLADNRPRTIGEIEAVVKDKNVQFSQLFQAVMVLSGAGYLAPAQSEAEVAAARPYTRRVNVALMQRAEQKDGVNYLVSPVTGGAIGISRVDMMFLKAWSQGSNEHAVWAERIWSAMEGAGQRIMVGGKAAESAEENRAGIEAAAEKFTNVMIPLLQGLEIAVREKVSPIGRKGSR